MFYFVYGYSYFIILVVRVFRLVGFSSRLGVLEVDFSLFFRFEGLFGVV